MRIGTALRGVLGSRHFRITKSERWNNAPVGGKGRKLQTVGVRTAVATHEHFFQSYDRYDVEAAAIVNGASSYSLASIIEAYLSATMPVEFSVRSYRRFFCLF